MTDEIKSTENFEELLEQSLKTLHTGEKVTGVVTQINTTEISVDLGVKQAGYIPMSELSDDPKFNVAEEIKVGDEVEAFVVRVNDVEGWIMLSKKRLDAVKNWEKLEQAVESKEALEGTIVDQNKGGIVANVLGIRVFIPASQTGLPREASFDGMMKTTQKVRISVVALSAPSRLCRLRLVRKLRLSCGRPSRLAASITVLLSPSPLTALSSISAA